MAAAAKQHPLSRWAIALGASALALIAYIGARGGPETAWQEFAEAFGYVKPPRIVTLQPKSAANKSFIISIENPSLRRSQITAYEAVPAIQMASAVEPAPGAGPLPVMSLEEARPSNCEESRRVQLPTPIVIEPKSSGGLELKPWVQECDFSIRVESTTGTSHKAYWSPSLEVMLKGMKRQNRQTYEVFIRSTTPEFRQHLRRQGIADE